MGRVAIVIVGYWLLSTAAAGTVAALAHFPTYSGVRGSFWEVFLLYTIPIPMALGMLHLPALLVGSVLLLLLEGRHGDRIISLLIFATGLLAVAHLIAHLADARGHWGWFAFVSVDVLLVLALGLWQRRRSAST
jgi:bacteriorhodopsin